MVSSRGHCHVNVILRAVRRCSRVELSSIYVFTSSSCWRLLSSCFPRVLSRYSWMSSPSDIDSDHTAHFAISLNVLVQFFARGVYRRLGSFLFPYHSQKCYCPNIDFNRRYHSSPHSTATGNRLLQTLDHYRLSITSLRTTSLRTTSLLTTSLSTTSL